MERKQHTIVSGDSALFGNPSASERLNTNCSWIEIGPFANKHEAGRYIIDHGDHPFQNHCSNSHPEIYFDGECPLCEARRLLLRISERLSLVNEESIGVFEFYEAHGNRYRGATYEMELKEINRWLGSDQ